METESINDKLLDELNKAEEKDRKYSSILIFSCVAVGLGSLATGGYLTYDYISRLERAQKQCVLDESTTLETSHGNVDCWWIDIYCEMNFGRRYCDR